MIREFKGSKATRDTDEDKLDVEGFISPLVLEAYAKYMHKNRFMKDGTVRDSDNWQGLFGDKHQAVCMQSLTRHFMDLWLLHRGHEAREDIDSALAGIMFNTMAIWYKILKDREQDDIEEVLGEKIADGVYGNKHIWEELQKIVNDKPTEE